MSSKTFRFQLDSNRDRFSWVDCRILSRGIYSVHIIIRVIYIPLAGGSYNDDIEVT